MTQHFRRIWNRLTRPTAAITEPDRRRQAQLLTSMLALPILLMLALIIQRVFSTKPEGKGTGLGLAICRRIVEEHGGTITITSEPGRGTLVHLRFPVISR